MSGLSMMEHIRGCDFTRGDQTAILKGTEALRGAILNAKQEQTQSIASGPAERQATQEGRKTQRRNGYGRGGSLSGPGSPQTVQTISYNRHSVCALQSGGSPDPTDGSASAFHSEEAVVQTTHTCRAVADVPVPRFGAQANRSAYWPDGRNAGCFDDSSRIKRRRLDLKNTG